VPQELQADRENQSLDLSLTLSLDKARESERTLSVARRFAPVQVPRAK
jgi:hypothetical protein